MNNNNNNKTKEGRANKKKKCEKTANVENTKSSHAKMLLMKWRVVTVQFQY